MEAGALDEGAVEDDGDDGGVRAGPRRTRGLDVGDAGARPVDAGAEQRAGGRPYYEVPAFTRHTGPTGDRLFVRYIRPFIQASQRHPDAPRLRPEQLEAMDAYDAFVEDPDNRLEMALAPGDIQFVNNYHVLHGRRAYVDDARTGRVRWLKRLWLATDILGPDDRPERFQRVGAMSHWGERRTRA